MKSLTTISVFLFLCLMTFSVLGQKINYEILDDDPAFNQLSIMPYLSVYSSMETTLGGFNLGGEVFVRKLPVHVRAHYDYALLNASITNEFFDAPVTMEIGAEYPMIKSNATKQKKFPLKSVGYTTVTTTYIMSDFNIEKMILARGGLMSYTGNFSYYNAEFNGVSSDFTVEGNYSTQGIYLGVASLSRSALKMNASSPNEDFGTIQKLRYFQFYADIIIGMGMDMGKFEDNGLWGSQGISYDIKEESTLGNSSVGFRLGSYYLITNKNHNANGSYLKWELGTRPSPENENIWFMVAYGLMFNMR
ncbi:MAG: hypothetical protein JXR10_15795 [Cyclobacteriaceae bacterium]